VTVRYLFIIPLIISCSTNRIQKKDIYYNDLGENVCINSYVESEETELEQISRVSEETLSTGASYLVTGVGYASDIVISVVGSVAIGVTICSPIIMAEGVVRGSGDASAACIERAGNDIFGDILDDGLGKNAHSNTASWRCSDVDHISKGLRRVASCLESKGERDKSLKQLKAILGTEKIKDCLSDRELLKVESEIKRLN
jgi:hypothetical protein